MPRSSTPRPLAVATASLAATLLLAACGSAEQSASGPASPSAGQSSGNQVDGGKVGRCPADAPAVKGARTVAEIDLDGDGRPEPVRLTAADSACPSLVFAQVGDAYLAGQLPLDGPPLSSAFGVQVPGETGELLVTRQNHPRGGFQLRLFVPGTDELAELEVDGQSLVPFAATDVQEHPLSIDCTEGGLVVTEAVAHEPPGVIFAWDVRRTTYALDGTVVTPGPTEEIADNVLPAQLEKKYPELVKHAAFPTCR